MIKKEFTFTDSENSYRATFDRNEVKDLLSKSYFEDVWPQIYGKVEKALKEEFYSEIIKRLEEYNGKNVRRLGAISVERNAPVRINFDITDFIEGVMLGVDESQMEMLD